MIRAAVREATLNAHWFLFIKNETDLPEICCDLRALEMELYGLPQAPDQQDRSACSGVWHAAPISRVF